MTLRRELTRAVPDIKQPRTKQKPSVKRVSEPVSYAFKNPRTLMYTRMQDLRTLAELRGGKLKDHREMTVFIYGVCCSKYCNTRESLLREVSLFMLAHIEPGKRYDHRQPEKLLTTVLSRFNVTATARNNGDTLDINYKLTSPYIIKSLEITAEEQTSLKSIIGKDREESKSFRQEEREAKS